MAERAPADAAPVPMVLSGVAPALSVSGLTFRTGAATLLDIDDLRLDGPGTTVVMGPNGAGKSVLLRLLHGLLVPSTGTVLSGDAPLSVTARRRQSMVFQSPVLLRRSVAANLEFAARTRGAVDAARCAALLRRVGLGDRGHVPARTLSGGERQRLALARALATAPDTLLLDEPTASLDPASTLVVERTVRDERAAGTRIVLVTHDIGQARRLADGVVFLHRGRLAEHTSAADFFDGPRSAAARAYLAGEVVL